MPASHDTHAFVCDSRPRILALPAHGFLQHPDA